MLRAAIKMNGPVAVRYPRGGEGRTYPAWTGDAAVVLRQGSDVTLAAYGTLTDEIIAAADMLAGLGISAEVVKLNRIAPLDAELVLDSVRKTKRLLVLEDCNENGSIGQQLAAAMAVAGAAPDWLVLRNIKNSFAPQGTVAQLREKLGLDAKGVAETVREKIHGLF